MSSAQMPVVPKRPAEPREVQGKKPSRPKKKDSNVVWFWANDCKYEVITDKVDSMGWKQIDDEKKESKCNLFWVDVATIHERLRTVQPWQMVNHFPGMPNIARKNRMGQNLNKFQKQFPREYNFFPRTWVLPGEMSDFRNQFDSAGNSIGNKFFILKPDAGCQGKGIFLTRTFDNVPQMDNYVAQVYLKKPLLIDGFKFDLRIYVLVTCVRPLRMYLFHDGLVRMCTEEYVKPTRQNINMTCMHLTNYAVNKNNVNFAQPGEANQEDGSKRALSWFLDWIREDYGEEKASRMWKKIGNITVKTLLTILPTLSREYDQVFKSFNNVPLVRPTPPSNTKGPGAGVDSGVQAAEGEGSGAGFSGEASGVDGEQLVGTCASSNGLPASVSEGDEHDQQEDDDGSEDGIGGVPGSCGVKLDKALMYRGSRCFEVLGLDIMIDSKLNPWMIEVNHLPSFGTDSPLDLDIKERLMEEVFNVIPVLPDDELAYNLHHKAEAEKRLTIDRTTASITKMRDKASVEKEREQERERDRQDRAAKRRAKDLAAAAERKRALSEERAHMNAHLKDTSENGQTNSAIDIETAGEDKGPPPYHSLSRIDQIKYHLVEIYTTKCPDKLTKIDRLLDRYKTREEEFLSFVCEKYGVTITIPEPPLPDIGAIEPQPDGSEDLGEARDQEERRGRSRDPANSSRESSRGRSRSTSLGMPDSENDTRTNRNKKVVSMPPVAKSSGDKATDSTVKGGARFGSRSLSPPASNSRRSSNWKGGDEEELFKLEVLQQHVPDENDLWMQREMRTLKSFTRIFPPETKPTKKTEMAPSDGSQAETSAKGKKCEESAEAGGSDGEDSDDGGDEAEEDAEEKPTASAAGASPLNGATEKKKLATFNEILLEAFLQDRRQTLRLRAPLANRNDKDSNSLPALDGNKPAAWGSAKASTAKAAGGHGWKPPMKPEGSGGSKKGSEKNPSSQAEVANRLYRGLSSSAAHQAASNILSNGSVTSSLNEPSLMDSVSGLAAGSLAEGDIGDVPNNGAHGIAFSGSGVPYNPNASLTSVLNGSNNITAADMGQYQRQGQNRPQYHRGAPAPRPGSLWGQPSNYVLDNGPGMTYIPQQFRGHSITEQQDISQRSQPRSSPVPAAPLRQQVFQFNGGPAAQPQPLSQQPTAVGASFQQQINVPNSGGLGIINRSNSDRNRAIQSYQQSNGFTSFNGGSSNR